MVAAELAKVPGVSNWLCGSAVTYRSETKAAWLGVDRRDIERLTAVSDEVARQMAIGVLDHTPEASLAASVTGHFGPGAPPGFDGIIFVGIASRDEGDPIADVTRHALKQRDRESRQVEATELVIQKLLDRVS